MNHPRGHRPESPQDGFDEHLAVALRTGVALPPRDPDLGSTVRSRVRARRRRRRVTYLGVVLVFVGMLAGLSLGPSFDRSDHSELATERTAETDSAERDPAQIGNNATASGGSTAGARAAPATDVAEPDLRPPTPWEDAAVLLLILGVPLAAAALTGLVTAGHSGRRRVATAVIAALAAQTLVLCATGVALMFTYQPLPPEIGGASLDSVDQDIAPGIIRGVHAIGSIVFPLLLIAGLLVLLLTLPSKTKALGIVAGVIVGVGTIGWAAEGLLRTGEIVGWDQLVVDEVTIGTDTRGIFRALDIDTVAWRDGSTERVVSEGTRYGVDGYRSAFIEHGLLTGLLIGAIGAGLVWSRGSMSSTRLLAYAGGWLAGFALFRYGLYVSGVLRARHLVNRFEEQTGIIMDTYQCRNTQQNARFGGRTTTIYNEVYASGLGDDIFYLWPMTAGFFCILASFGYAIYGFSTDDFRKKRLIHLVPVALVIMTAIVVASTHALGVTSCVLE